MISLARADMTHPVTTEAPIGPLYWVATSLNSSTLFLQIANVDETAIPVSGIIHGARQSARGSLVSTAVKTSSTSLAPSPNQVYNVTNSLSEPNTVVPRVAAIDAKAVGQDIVFGFMVPGRSFGVYRFTLQD